MLNKAKGKRSQFGQKHSFQCASTKHRVEKEKSPRIPQVLSKLWSCWCRLLVDVLFICMKTNEIASTNVSDSLPATTELAMAKLTNHLEERLLDQAQVRASYTPPFLGSFA